MSLSLRGKIKVIVEIRFQTKKESNKQQQEDFLKLSKTEKFYSFLRLSERISKFPVKK